jgi:hypothetical protein
MTLLMKSWGWPNHSQKGQRMNASENFHIKLHKCNVKVSQLPKIMKPSLKHLQVHMTSSYAMHVSIKIYTLNYFTRSAGMHVIPKPCHTQNKQTYTCNNFSALDLWTQTYPKGTPVNLYNHINRVIILLAKQYNFVNILNIWLWTTNDRHLLHLNLPT